ncbi:unnamed protein product, partial [Coregonus sp. 'balchen']
VILYTNGTLLITQVKPRNIGSYRCVGRGPRGPDITLEASLLIAEIEDMSPSQSRVFTADTMQRVSCRAPHGKPLPEVWWEREGVRVPTEGRVYQEGSELVFSPTEQGDSGSYTCVAQNKAGRKTQELTFTVAKKLKFTPTPQPTQCLELDKEVNIQCSATGRETPTIKWTKAVYIRFKLEPEYTTVYQGHTAVLHCQATADPEPHIQWMVKDKVLDTSRRRFQLMLNGSLVITDVTTDDTGKYTCIAGNSCSISDRVAQLYVVEKPVQTLVDHEEKAPYKMIQTIGLSVGAAVAYIIVVLGLMFYCKKRRNAKRLQKGQEGEEPEMECLNTEIQEEVALTSVGTTAAAEKRHSSANEKLHFPRADLHTITTLGKGEFGEVLLAKAKGIEEGEEETVVLVKSLQSRDEQLQLDFRREADMFSKLSHGNVGDLKQFLRISKSKDEKSNSQPIATKTKVAHGMEHMSNHRFVHKDLAARNCLISGQRSVKISAPSLSKDVYNSEYYHYRQVWIPLRWLPAESVFEDDFSTKSDVWAFGVLMWEVFSHGELPYTKLSDDEVLEGLQAGKMKLPVPDGCPSKVYKLMCRCWAPSLKERPSFSEVVNALGDLSSDSNV